MVKDDDISKEMLYKPPHNILVSNNSSLDCDSNEIELILPFSNTDEKKRNLNKSEITKNEKLKVHKKDQI